MASSQLSIGTDPELVLSRRGAIVKAGDVIYERDSKFGVDGHPYTAELRPDPAIHPRDLVESIRKTLASRSEQLGNYVWLAGPWVLDKPLGGHIHFGVPFEERFRDALNFQFGPILALIEPQKEAAQRRTFPFYNGRAYGALGDIREKKWGFEFRTPASYIVSPGVTLATLAIAKAIVWEEMNRSTVAWSMLSQTERNSMVFDTNAFNQCKKEVFMAKLPEIEKQLQQMLYFKTGQEGRDLWPAVSYLINRTIKNKGYRIGHDIKLKWKLIASAQEESAVPPPPLISVPVINWWKNTSRAIRPNQFVVHDFTEEATKPLVAPAAPNLPFTTLKFTPEAVWGWIP